MALNSIKIENFLRHKNHDGKSKNSNFSKIAKKNRTKLRRRLLKNYDFVWVNNYYRDWEY